MVLNCVIVHHGEGVAVVRGGVIVQSWEDERVGK